MSLKSGFDEVLCEAFNNGEVILEVVSRAHTYTVRRKVKVCGVKKTDGTSYLLVHDDKETWVNVNNVVKICRSRDVLANLRNAIVGHNCVSVRVSKRVYENVHIKEFVYDTKDDTGIIGFCDAFGNSYNLSLQDVIEITTHKDREKLLADLQKIKQDRENLIQQRNRVISENRIVVRDLARRIDDLLVQAERLENVLSKA